MSTTTRKFKTVITNTGAKKLAQAAAPDGKPVRLTHMAWVTAAALTLARQ
ncbi:phage protein gpH [Escherichia coli]|nr:phage protein gpH [Escherichia coli]